MGRVWWAGQQESGGRTLPRLRGLWAGSECAERGGGRTGEVGVSKAGPQDRAHGGNASAPGAAPASRCGAASGPLPPSREDGCAGVCPGEPGAPCGTPRPARALAGAALGAPDEAVGPAELPANLPQRRGGAPALEAGAAGPSPRGAPRSPCPVRGP